MKFGEYECFSVNFGDFFGDGGAMFGVVPKVLWEKKIPADSKNRIPMRSNCLLIQGRGKNILVDTGCGNKFSEKEKQRFNIDKDFDDVDSVLSKHGLSSADITDVLLTHLHFDHAGGATTIMGNTVVPTFPNAVYYIQKDQWKTAINPNIRDRSGFIKDNFVPLETSNVLRLLDGPEKLFEGIDLIVTCGHTLGLQHLLIEGDGESLFYCTDLFPTTAHLPIPWHMAFDISPLTIMEEKEKILKRAQKENWILFFEHDPYIVAARINKTNEKIEIDHEVML